LNTECALLGRRRWSDVKDWFGVNMSFRHKDRIWWKIYMFLKFMEQKILGGNF